MKTQIPIIDLSSLQIANVLKKAGAKADKALLEVIERYCKKPYIMV